MPMVKKFLHIVEGLVLETILEKLFGISRKGVSDVDAPTRFYVFVEIHLW